jgi:hypothetical protein
MIKVGDEIDGFCPRCKLNMYMIVSATDGREVFTTTCRTCRNTAPYRPEVSLEEIRAKQVKKLGSMMRRKAPQHTPDVVQFASRKADKGDLAMPMRAFREMMGRDPDAAPPPSAGPIGGPRGAAATNPPASAAATPTGAPRREAPTAVAAAGTTAAVGTAETSGGGRWHQLTAHLSARDGRPYNAARSYKAGDVLLHKSHGLGIVESLVHEGAILVLFRELQTVLQMNVPPGHAGR